MVVSGTPIKPDNSCITVAGFAKLYNVTIYNEENKRFIGKQFYAKDIIGAIVQGQEYGSVVKACESAYDSERCFFSK